MTIFYENKRHKLNLGSLFATGVNEVSLIRYSNSLQTELAKIFQMDADEHRYNLALDQKVLSRFGIGQTKVRRLSRDRKDVIVIEITEIINLLDQYHAEIKKLPDAFEVTK